MRATARQHGLTLLEVVLALALAGGLLAGVLTFHRQVLDMRQKVAQRMEVLAAERMVMERLTLELRSALPDNHFGLVMEGSATYLEFHYSELPGPAVWSEDPELFTAQSDVKRVTWRLLVSEDEQDGPYIAGIERFARDHQPLPEAEEVEADPPGAVRSLFEPFRFFHLRYWDGGQWAASWSGGDLPVAIEVTLGIRPLPVDLEPHEYPYETFRRVMAVPSSALRPSDDGPADFDALDRLFDELEQFDLDWDLDWEWEL